MSRYDPKWVSEYYDDYGDQEWERWDKSPVEQVKLHIHRHYIEQYVKKGDYVLEIGAGAGRFTQVLANIGARVLVADISEGQLELNRRHSRRLGFDHAVEDWLQLDMCDMRELPEKRYDAVVCYGGPLSYVFDRRGQAMGEIIRVLKDSGLALISVMSLWGTVHQYLPGVLEVPPEENAEIIQSGDLHPETYKNCNHRAHMFRAHELQELLEKQRVTVLCMSASNCLSATYGDGLIEIRNDPVKWAGLLKMEREASREPGCLDMGTHLIGVIRKDNS